MRFLFLIFFFISSSVFGLSSAQEDQFQKCYDLATSTAKHRACQDQEQELLERELNLSVQRFRKTLLARQLNSAKEPIGQIQRFIAYERSWKNFRTATCEMEASANGQSSLAFMKCFIHFTKQHIEDIEKSRQLFLR
jgi:uncharacterized protein YecT (DUF1311 family)